MPLVRAVYDQTTGTYSERPFDYVSTPMIPGTRLDEDIEIYLACAHRAGVVPTAPSLLFFGDGAEGLFLRRNWDRAHWDAFVAHALGSAPGLAVRNSELITRVSKLAIGDRAGTTRKWPPTMPETCVGGALLDIMPAGITVIGDAALPGGRGPKGHVRRCDYHLSWRRREARLEVNGLVNRNGPPPTYDGVRYGEIRIPERRAAYAELGLAPAFEIYADEVLDRPRLVSILAEVIAQLM